MEETVVKKPTSPLLYIGIGLVALLLFIGIGATIFFKFFAKKAVETVIEDQIRNTAVNDAPTDQLVDLGAGKVPDDFPKDFPLYPGATVTSALTGSKTGNLNSFILSLSTPDTAGKVTGFYATQLQANGWTTGDKTTGTDSETQNVSKKIMTGTLTIVTDPNTKGSVVVIDLGQESRVPAPSQ
jgi:hypothetical protein